VLTNYCNKLLLWSNCNESYSLQFYNEPVKSSHPIFDSVHLAMIASESEGDVNKVQDCHSHNCNWYEGLKEVFDIVEIVDARNVKMDKRG